MGKAKKVQTPSFEYVMIHEQKEPKTMKYKNSEKRTMTDGFVKIRKISKKTGKPMMMNVQDMKRLEKQMKETFFNGPKDTYYMRVYGISVSQCYTIKATYEDELDTDDFEEYMNGRVNDPSKFHEVFQLTIGYSNYS